MRLIDADALLNKKFKYMVHGCDDLLITIKASDIENAPTIDAVEVVRCEKCKHRLKSGHCKMCRHSDGSMRYVMEDEFCSMGVREGVTE